MAFQPSVSEIYTCGGWVAISGTNRMKSSDFIQLFLKCFPVKIPSSVL